jgi:hypothetical protein
MPIGRSKPDATSLQNAECWFLIADFRVCETSVLCVALALWAKSEIKPSAEPARLIEPTLHILYRDALDKKLGKIAPIRSKRHRKPPTVLTQAEGVRVLSEAIRPLLADHVERVVIDAASKCWEFCHTIEKQLRTEETQIPEQ